MVRNRATQIIVVFAAAAAVGCGKKIVPAAPSAAGPSVANALPAAPTAARERNALVQPTPAATLSEDELFAKKTLDELNAERPLQTVHFAVDSSVLDNEARTVLEANAKWLTRWPTTQVFINGHTDERATAEYNLALGDRRAAVVREYLTNLGVSATRLVPVSKGEEAPVCRVEAESCWWQNRRGMFVISAK
jgi:peptidoglycan-associated lipoprotein